MRKTMSLLVAVTAFAARAQVQQGSDGGGDVSFSLTGFAEWSDNRGSVSGETPETPVEGVDYGKQDAIKFGIGPGIEALWRSGRTEWRLGYRPVYQWWDDSEVGQVESELTHDAHASLSYLSGARLELLLGDSLMYNDDPDLYMGDELDLPEDTDSRLRTSNSYFENRLKGNVKYRLQQRLFTLADAFWRTRRYDEDEVAQRGDEDEIGASLGLSFQQTPFLSYGVYLAYTAFDRETDLLRESGEEVPMGLESASIGLSAQYRLSEGASLSGRYGYQYVQYENEEIDDREYPTEASLELKFAPTRRSQVLLGGRLAILEGYDFPYIDQEQQSAYASLSYHHTPRVSTTYRAEYRISKYEEQYADPGTRDDAFQGDAASKPRESRNGDRNDLFLRLGLNFRWNDNLTLSGYYSYEDVDSDVSESYSSNIVGVRANYQF